MREFPEESIDFVMTSPPYWGLRNYGEATETVWDDDCNCKHEWTQQRMTLVHENRNFQKGTQEEVHGEKPTTYIKKYDDQVAGFCVKCGAWKGQLGLEPSWQMYVSHMVTVCQELKRVLKKTGSMYIVLGDTYAGSGQGHKISEQREAYKKYSKDLNFPYERPTVKVEDYKSKCLMGIPWRVAFALIDDGWILRNDIIWHKPNAMPSSVKDRLTQTYEHIFHFVKNRKYYYNLDAIREPHQTSSLKRAGISGVVPFNLRVRDVKRGKKGVFVEAGKVKQLKASKEEVENYVYPERKHHIGDGYRQGMNRDESRLIEKRPFLPKPEELVMYLRKWKGSWSYDSIDKALGKEGDTASHWFTDSNSEHGFSYPSVDDWVKLKKLLGFDDAFDKQMTEVVYETSAVMPQDRIQLTKHDVAVRRFPTVNREGGLGYTDPLHVKAYHEKGKNPGDTFQTRKKPYIGNNPHRMRLQNEQFLALDSSRPMDLSHPKGKNPGDFWNVCTKPFKGAHFAVYPEAICVNPILSSCPPNGVVLDPMCGSGTTLVVAKKLGRNFVGIEINPAYVEIARKRLSKIPCKLDKFVMKGY
jgi:DNA modification methylase